MNCRPRSPLQSWNRADAQEHVTGDPALVGYGILDELIQVNRERTDRGLFTSLMHRRAEGSIQVSLVTGTPGDHAFDVFRNR